jgi:hypothetical protein
VEIENTRKLLGESPADQRAEPSQRAGTQDEAPEGGTMTLSVPKLGLKDVPVPAADSQVALDREGIIRLKETGAP